VLALVFFAAMYVILRGLGLDIFGELARGIGALNAVRPKSTVEYPGIGSILKIILFLVSTASAILIFLLMTVARTEPAKDQTPSSNREQEEMRLILLTIYTIAVIADMIILASWFE
jgi:hypothetical protein